MTPSERVARRTAIEVLDDLKVGAYPIDPEAIARRKGLLFEERGGFPDAVFGAFFRAGNRFGIVVSTACFGEGHRRFTIAHELGHYFLPGHVEELLPAGRELAPSFGGHFRTRKDPREVEADSFASELLMPAHFVRPLLTRAKVGLPAVQIIAESFIVSLTSAAIRFADLTDEAVAVLVSRDGVVEWAARSDALWRHSWARASLKKEWAPRGAATRRLCLDPQRLSTGESERDAQLLCEWFDAAPTSVEVREDAVGLGAYGRVLTVLHVPDLPEPEELDEGTASAGEEGPGDWRDALRGYRLG